jgi:serine/threonine protein kinase
VSTHRFELICAPLLRSALLTSGDDCPEFEKTLFLREMETMIRMRHPNVVQFLGYVDSPFAIALEFLPSGDLKAYWQKNRLSVAKKMGICVDVLRALAYMHNRKPKACIHRDVKPANIMMSRSGVAKLSDFGLARMTQFARKERSDHGGLEYVGAESPGAKDDGSNDNSKLSKEVGTKRYMAPEATAQVYTSAVDIFSAGATFYELFEQARLRPHAAVPSVARSGPAARPRSVTLPAPERRVRTAQSAHCLCAVRAPRSLRAISSRRGRCGRLRLAPSAS